MDTDAIRKIIEAAEAGGRDTLLETEGLEILAAMGIRSPSRLFAASADEAEGFDLCSLRGEKVVLKVVSPDILHKSDAGGVAVVERTRGAVAGAVKAMAGKVAGKKVSGYTLNEFVDYDKSLGGELLLGLRWTEDFGPVVVFGPGGVYTEFLAKAFRPGMDIAVFSPECVDPGGIERSLRRSAVTALVADGLRGLPPRAELSALAKAACRMADLARELSPDFELEFEVNPLVATPSGLIALDALCKFRRGKPPPGADRPVSKLKNLLEARSAAIIGVSEKMNTGRVILRNMLAQGFDPQNLFVVKSGLKEIDGCRCVPGVKDLPARVDLAILTVPAGSVGEVAADFIEGEMAESMIIIPGGLEEKSGGDAIASRMRAALETARASAWRGPVINGGNCLGVGSRPGRYNTIFIPGYKMRSAAPSAATPLAFISQSGAFAVSKLSKLEELDPKFTVTIGNQTDLTVGDYLTYLKDDLEIAVYAVYVEGFKPLDGLRFLKAAKEISGSGRTVIFYRAGRTSEGKKMSASHTASVAGDYAVSKALAEQAGVIVAESVSDFEHLTRLFLDLRGKAVRGMGLGAVSNAGFECVAFADNLNGFHLAEFSKGTQEKLARVFKTCRIDGIVDVHNPADLTPMTGDEGYEAVSRAILEDENVHAGIIGVVPLSPALNTLPEGGSHKEDLRREDSVVSRLIRLMAEGEKPWVCVVDAGVLYDPMARALEKGGVPVFRSQDGALRLFGAFCEARLVGRSKD